jgi:hypothetical protein
MLRLLFLSLSVFLLSTTAWAVTIDLDARENGAPGMGNADPVFLQLSAGNHAVVPISGRFTAWNAWSSRGNVTDCEGDACRKGWVNNWSIFTPDSGDIPFLTLSSGTGDADRRAWRTPELALANALGLTFTLSQTQRVGFAIRDNPVRDNIGGMSLSVSSMPVIPLPAAGILLLTGLGGLVLMSRRRA